MKERNRNIVLDDWLTKILKKDVYQLVVDEELLGKVGDKASGKYKSLQELQSRSVFIYAKVSTEALPAVKFLEQQGFHLIDTNATFEKPIAKIPDYTGNSIVRFTLPEDQQQVVELARDSFTYSRFHLDNAIPHEVSNKLRAEWAKNYYAGLRGDAMVVALTDGAIAGFLLLIYSKDGPLIIDLIAVAETQRRKGIAKDMITWAEYQCKGFDNIRVGTQLANLPSIKLYEGMGFKLTEAQYTFHYHHD